MNRGTKGIVKLTSRLRLLHFYSVSGGTRRTNCQPAVGPKYQAYRLAKVAISPMPSSLRSAVTKVNLSTLAVAARNLSAGSACGNGRARPTLTISRVKGASRICSAARSTHSKGSAIRILPFCISVRASQTLTGDNQSSLAGFDNSVSTRLLSRAGLPLLQIQMWVSRRRFNRGKPRSRPNR